MSIRNALASLVILFSMLFVSSPSALAQTPAKDKPAETAAPATAPANPGMIRLFRVETETVSIKSDPIPAATFDLPAGYKKVAGP